MCSRQEGFGRVTVEYMMAGLPVIASDIAANKELINSETGLLYHVGDIHSLKEKIVYLVNHRDLIEKMGRKAREYAQTSFSTEINTELVYNEYLKIIRK